MSTPGLFGDDDSSSDEDVPMQVESPAKAKEGEEGDAEFDDQGAVVGLSSTTIAGTKANESAPADDEEKAQEKEEIQVDSRKLVVQKVPKLNPQELFMTKLPNLVGIQTEAFDPDDYSPGAEEDEFGPQSSYNLMRWRFGQDGKRESNTRLVQWEDNTWTLHVGDESFEADIIDSSDKKTGFAGLNGYIYLSQKASYKQDEETTPAGTVLECVGNVNSRMTIKPSSLQSEAHKSLTVAVRQKTIKRARIAQFTTTEDPEKLKEERIRVKADLEKAAMRKSGGGGGGYRRSGGGRRPRMSKGYLEEDEDYDTTNIRAMKRGMYDRDDDEPDDYAVYDEDSDEDDVTFQKGRPKAKKAKYDDDDEEEEVFGGDDDDEDEVAPVKAHKTKKQPTKSLFDDDDSD